MNDVKESGGEQLSALNPSSSQTISAGGAETVVTKSNIPSSGLAPAIPIVANSLISLMVIYSILTLLLIAVIWFVVGKKIWNSWKKTDPLHSYSQIRYQ